MTMDSIVAWAWLDSSVVVLKMKNGKYQWETYSTGPYVLQDVQELLLFKIPQLTTIQLFTYG